MIFRFGTFERDTDKMELREGGEPRQVEPQVFALPALLIDNRVRMVSKDEIIEKIWEGRIVSEAAVASRIKSARAAVGDDGRAQRVIRTAHREGVRFVAPVEELGPAIIAQPRPIADEKAPDSRPSLAVLPFRPVRAKGPHATIADALPADFITDLSRLHWLLVIARLSSFRLRDAEGTLARARDVAGRACPHRDDRRRRARPQRQRRARRSGRIRRASAGQPSRPPNSSAPFRSAMHPCATASRPPSRASALNAWRS